jgi:hypothetical protein
MNERRFKQFTANVQQGRHYMFIFGHSLAENDDHILNRIGRGRCRKLYVGIYGDPTVEGNQQIIARAQALACLRTERWPVEVAFYDGLQPRFGETDREGRLGSHAG